MDQFHPIRYARITEKNNREIVMLRGRGCSWRKCRFCDYHYDFSLDEASNFKLNEAVLGEVTGLYQRLEVINSGSFTDLDEATIGRIEAVALSRDIRWLHVECHWNDREAMRALKQRWAQRGICVKVKTGVETFDSLFRESYLCKGITTHDPAEIAAWFDECCLLQGIPGQTAESMLADIQTGLEYFERVCINIMQNNTKSIKADPKVIRLFAQEIYPRYRDNERVDILMENTDFGVGGARDE